MTMVHVWFKVPSKPFDEEELLNMIRGKLDYVKV